MRRLFRVELARLRWRRAVILLLLAAVVVPAFIAFSVIWDTRPPSQAELDQVRDNASSEIARCERRPHQFGVRKAELCEEQVLSWYTSYQPLRLGQQRHTSGVAVAAVLTLPAIFVTHSFTDLFNNDDFPPIVGQGARCTEPSCHHDHDSSVT